MEIRLKKQKDFDTVFKKGKRVYNNSVTIIFIKESTTKVGISLSKKHGKAVVRNKIKRILRALIKEFIPLLNDNYYIVVMPKVLEEYNYWALKEDLKKVLKRGNLINE